MTAATVCFWKMVHFEDWEC